MFNPNRTGNLQFVWHHWTYCNSPISKSRTWNWADLSCMWAQVAGQPHLSFARTMLSTCIGSTMSSTHSPVSLHSRLFHRRKIQLRNLRSAFVLHFFDGEYRNCIRSVFSWVWQIVSGTQRLKFENCIKCFAFDVFKENCWTKVSRFDKQAGLLMMMMMWLGGCNPARLVAKKRTNSMRVSCKHCLDRLFDSALQSYVGDKVLAKQRLTS